MILNHTINATSERRTTVDKIFERAKAWLKEPSPDNGAPEHDDVAEARIIISGLLNECSEKDLSFSAAIQNIDRKYERIQLLGSAINKAVQRFEEIERRDGGPDWRRAKDLLKSDLSLIKGGLLSISAESV